jgi:glycosyltransferase involved in cell wall biosynthesis
MANGTRRSRAPLRWPIAMSLTVIIPACNEEDYLDETLMSIETARLFAPDLQIEVIVVDNGSTDRTALVAGAAGAKVVAEPIRNVARARNRGAASAGGGWLLFVDADTVVPKQLFRRIAEVLDDERCIGGAADTLQSSNRLLIRLYLQLWRFIGTVAGMAQGAAQFCTRDAFDAAGGYDESLWMGEDVDFYWRLRKLAKRNAAHVHFLRDLRVHPSSRRFDRWSVWEILLRTNPLFILLFRRRRSAWKGWYDQLIR